MSIILTLWFAGSFPSCAAQTAEESDEETTPDEERLLQKIKAEVLQDFQQGDWLAQQIELWIEKYIRKLQLAKERETRLDGDAVSDGTGKDEFFVIGSRGRSTALLIPISRSTFSQTAWNIAARSEMAWAI